MKQLLNYIQMMLLTLLTFIIILACKKAQPVEDRSQEEPVDTAHFYGVMFSYDVNVSNAIPKLNDLGVKWCRLWVNISDWNTPSNNTGAGYQQAIDLHHAGFKVILELNSLNGTVPTYAQAKAVFEWMIAKPELKASVDVWEIFNELNNTQYYNQAYSTTLSMSQQAQNYINGALKAGWDVFHVANNEKVLGGSWTLWQQKEEYSTIGSYNLKLTQAYLDNGYLNYCDYAGIHPYHGTAPGQVTFVTDFKNRIGGKPIIITEWGLKLTGYTVTTYTDAMSNNIPFLRNNVLTACYYRFTPGNGYYGLVSGTNYATQIEPAYTTYKNWPGN